MKFSLWKDKEEKPKPKKERFRFGRKKSERTADKILDPNDVPEKIKELYSSYEEEKPTKTWDDMSYDELGKEYDFWQKQYSRNPTESNRKMISDIGDLMQNYEERKKAQQQKFEAPRIEDEDKLSADDENRLSEIVTEISAKHGIDWSRASPTKKQKIIEYAKKELEVRKQLDGIVEEEEPESIPKSDVKKLYAEIDVLKGKVETLTKEKESYQVELTSSSDTILQLRKDVHALQEEINKQAKIATQKMAEEQVKIDPEVKKKMDFQNESEQITYELMQKKPSVKKEQKEYALNNLQLLCRSCNHYIQFHAKKGVSTGCRKCGCLVTIEAIAKENGIDLIERKQFTQLTKDNKKPLFNMPKLKKPVKPKPIIARVVEVDDQTIEEQAKRIQSMTNPKIQKRAEQLEVATKKKLEIDQGKVMAKDKCTCGHIADKHFKYEEFCTEKGCKCKIFRDYPS